SVPFSAGRSRGNRDTRLTARALPWPDSRQARRLAESIAVGRRSRRKAAARGTIMKLRIRSNSVRIRMDRKDLADLIERGRVVDALRFGPGKERTLAYAVVLGPAPAGRPDAAYAAGLLVVTIDRGDAEAWAAGDRVGFDHEQLTEGGTVRVILEKDFACLDRPAGSEGEDARAFPNPSAVCK